MSCPNTIKLNKSLYYSADELHKYDIAFFTGVYKNIRNIIKIKNISIDNYKYAYVNKKCVWIESKESYARAKVLLTSEWVENNVPKVIIHKRQEIKIQQENNKEEEEEEEVDMRINDLFDMVQNAYAGHCKELIMRIKELENYNKIIEEKHTNELQKENHKNELNEEKHKNELKDKDIELLQMKLIISEMKNK